MKFIRKNTYPLLSVILAFGFVLFTNPSLGLLKPEGRTYAVLDTDRIVDNSVAYKEFKLRWGRVNDKYQKEIEFYESQLLELEQKITHSGTKKPNAEVRDSVYIVDVKQRIGMYEVKVQRLLRERKNALDGAFDKATEILKNNIDKLVKDYAVQNHFDVIFAKSQVIYSADAIDITDFILKKLNSNLKILEVKI
jgi:Skp family chaperone for outer membrane proteins